MEIQLHDHDSKSEFQPYFIWSVISIISNKSKSDWAEDINEFKVWLNINITIAFKTLFDLSY